MQSSELRRRLCHMAPGLLPFLLWPYSHRDPISPTLYYIVLGLTAALATGVFTQYRRIERIGEQNQRYPAIAGYAASVLVTILLFPGQLELGLTVLAILAFGDGSATFGGILIGGPRLPWNPEKSVSGFLCFLLVGIPMSAVTYWGEANNLEALKQSVPVTIPLSFVIAGAATVFAGVVESLPSKINDNIRVGITAAVVLVIMHGALIGFQQTPLEPASKETTAQGRGIDHERIVHSRLDSTEIL
jgi:dolichol kinase